MWLGWGTGDEGMEQCKRRMEGLEAKGTGHRTMRTGQTMGGGGAWEGEVRGGGLC